MYPKYRCTNCGNAFHTTDDNHRLYMGPETSADISAGKFGLGQDGGNTLIQMGDATQRKKVGVATSIPHFCLVEGDHEEVGIGMLIGFASLPIRG